MDVLDLLMLAMEYTLMGFALAAGGWVFERLSRPDAPDDDEEEEAPKVKGKRSKGKNTVVRWTA
jgi:hypothetical protein